MPVNWYAALVVIVLVGVASIAFAKYHYDQHPPVVEPTTNTTWHAALAFDVCGTMQPALPASPTGGSTGLTSSGDGVLVIAPKTASEAGNNATLGKFASGYTGLTLTNTSLKYPSPSSPEYKNGQKCAAGTPDAGKVGEVIARTWVLSTASNGEQKEVGGVTTVHPADLKFVNRQLITVGFVPSGTELPKPPSSTILALVQVLSGTQPTPTTTTPTTGTSTSQTPTTAATTTTSVPATTTTKPSSTTTTK